MFSRASAYGYARAQAARSDDPALVRACVHLPVLKTQREDVSKCLHRLLDELPGNRRLFRLYRQFKMYHDPRLNPALSRTKARGVAR